MTICNDLRQAVLQAAFQGKLTKQLSEDGSAADLLAGIKAEKERLIREKKIKKEKPLEAISEDETPFDIPENWAWAHLGEVFQHNTGKALNAANKNGVNLEYITTSNLYWDRFEIGSLRKMYFSETEIDKCTVRKGDLLVCEGGDIGRAAIWPYDFEMRIQNHIHRLRPYVEVNIRFFYYLFYLYKMAGWIGGKGIGIQGLSANALHTIVFPIPPLTEQQRIVARVEELMAQIDEMEKTENELVALKKAFPSDMKASLLQAAMQGKLTKQLPEDGSAADLLAKIKAEKERLICEKKIKKEKPLAPISENEIPFDIPENWEWAYLGEVFQHNTGKALNAANRNGVNLEYITTSNLYWDKFELGSLRKMYFSETEIDKCTVRKGDLLVCEGGDIGRAAIWPYDCEVRIQNHIHRLRPYVEVNMRFFYYLFYLYKIAGWIGGKGIGIQGLSANALHITVFPIPPLAEQQRIVEKLDKLLPLCDDLADAS